MDMNVLHSARTSLRPLMKNEPSACVSISFVFNSQGRQLGRGRNRQRPNDKFRPDCWSEDEQLPNQPGKTPRQQQQPCLWEMDYPSSIDYYD